MKIQMKTGESACHVAVEEPLALINGPGQENAGKTVSRAHRRLCLNCGAAHPHHQRCNPLFRVLNWLSPIGYTGIDVFYIRLHQFCFVYLMMVLPTAILLNISYYKFIYPHFASTSENDTYLPDGLASSSFVFTRDEVFVGKVALKPCDGFNQTIEVDTLQWTPAAVNLDSPVFLNMSTRVMDEIRAPVEVSVDVSKFVFITWVSIPCIDGLGSCTYEDVCALDPTGVLPCPNLPNNFNIPCACPFQPGKYFIKNGKLQLPGSGAIPEWLTRGWFKAAVKVRDPILDKQLACYEAKIQIH